MHARIREKAYKHNFHEDNGTLIILIDTIISVMTLCTVPEPEKTIRTLSLDFLFYEHVLSGRKDVAWWQRLWTPLWTVCFDGCKLDRPTHLYIRHLVEEDDKGRVSSVWSEGTTWNKKDEPVEHLFWHQVGRFIRKTV
ncbi:hypothetical protein DL96DRAFT_1597502 [Flagelloscypha sp. PMI_526]|nr:hypothetical protein DL96DRAFT_1597502 [Flagelloscypha sp. PMI_526]